MGIRHAKPYTLRGGPLTKLEQRSDSQTHVLHLHQGLPAKIEIMETVLQKRIAMAAPELNGTNALPCLSNPNPAEPKSDNYVKIETSIKIIMKLRNNAYNGDEANNEKGYDDDLPVNDEESSDEEIDKSKLMDNQDINPSVDPYQNSIE
ncbi:hypothetical protein Tco_1354853 [Tanacetum coccineum]